MDAGTVEVWEVCVFGIEDEGEIGTGEQDGVQMFTLDEGMRQPVQRVEVVREGCCLFDNAGIDGRDQVDFCSCRRDDFLRGEPAEDAGFDGDARTEDGDAAELRRSPR